MKTISLKLPETLLRSVTRVAEQRGLNQSELVREAIERYLAENARPQSALDLAGDVVGCLEGPGDLSTNPKYMEGFGQ